MHDTCCTTDRHRRQLRAMLAGWGRTEPTEEEMLMMAEEDEARAARLGHTGPSWDAPEGRGWVGDVDNERRAARTGCLTIPLT